MIRSKYMATFIQNPAPTTAEPSIKGIRILFGILYAIIATIIILAYSLPRLQILMTTSVMQDGTATQNSPHPDPNSETLPNPPNSTILIPTET